MNHATKLESMLDYMCTDVTEVISENIELARYYVDSTEHTARINVLIEAAMFAGGSLDKVIEAAAIVDVLLIIRKAILTDLKVREKELDAAAELLSQSMHRYCWMEDYEEYLFISDGDDFRNFLFKWGEDKSALGGDLKSNPPGPPFQAFTILACVIANSTSLYKMYIQSIKLIAKFIIESDGISATEHKFYEELMRSFESSLESLESSLSGHQTDSANSLPEDAIEIEFPPEQSAEEALKKSVAELNALIGVTNVKNEIARLTNFLKVRAQRIAEGLQVPTQSLHFVFTGNPGTGKTTVARLLGKILHGFGVLKTPKFIEADRSRLIGGYIGQTALKTSEVIESSIDGVLFIDEAYTLSKQGVHDYGQEAIETLLKRMEDLRDRLVVIVAGYPELMTSFIESNPGLRSRFTRFIRFEDYHVSELCRIFEKMCDANGYLLTQEARGNLAIILNRAYSERDSTFGNGRYVRNAYEMTLGNHSDRLASLSKVTRAQLQTIEAVDLPFSLAVGHGVDKPFDLTNSRWQVQCPRCSLISGARLAVLGRSVKCKCGLRFKCPWWNLDKRTVRGLVLWESSGRDIDLLGYDIEE
jgi:hypothetical protein